MSPQRSRPRRQDERRDDDRGRRREEATSPIRAGVEGIGAVVLIAGVVGAAGYLLALVVAWMY